MGTSKQGDLTIMDALAMKDTIDTIDTVEALRDVRSEWDRLQGLQEKPDPNADYEHFVTVASHKPGVLKPCVLVARNSSRVHAIVGGRIERHNEDFKIGYKTLFSAPSRSLTVVSGGVLMDPRFTDREGLAQALRRGMKEQGVDTLIFHSCDESSPFFSSTIRGHPGAPLRFPLVLSSAPWRHWRMSIPAGMDEFYQARSKNHRKNLKNHVKRLKREYPGWEVRRFTMPEEVNGLFAAVETVASGSYQRGLGVGFVLDDLTRERFSLAARKGWLRSYVLYLDGRPCAFQLAFQYRDCLYAKGKAYDQSYSRFGIGTFLFLFVLEEVAKEKKVKWWDFGIGDSEYKRMYGTSSWTERNVYWCMGTPRGVVTALAFGTNKAATRLGRALVETSGTARAVKRAWRKRAARRETS